MQALLGDVHAASTGLLTGASGCSNVLSVSSTNIPRRRLEVASAAMFWCGVFVLLTVAAAAIGLVKRGLPLEGWSGTPMEQALGWTLLTSPHVLVAWLPVALGTIAISAVSNLSRRAWVSLSLVLALGLLVLFGAVA
jgi:hypothetical protein